VLAISFLFPALLGVAAAAVAPVIIHLIMRTRPRRQVFPAMRFVKKSHQANISKLRLRHLILLAMRMAAILLLALLIARPRLEGLKAEAGSFPPTAAVLVLDNSASMNYRQSGQSLLARGQQLSQGVIASLARGSRVAVMALDYPPATAAMTSDLALAAQQVADVPAGASGTPVAGAIDQAARMLHSSELPRKVIYLVTDLTAPAWRPPPAVPADVELIVLDSGATEPMNIAIERVELSPAVAAVGSDVTARAHLRSLRLGGQFTIQAELDGQTQAQQLVRIEPGGSATVDLPLRPRAGGMLHGRVVVRETRDPLAIDDEWHLVVESRQPVKVLVVRDDASRTLSPQALRNEAHFLMANAVAPPGVDWARRQTIAASRLADQPLDDVAIVMLADVSSLPGPTWQKLGRYVRDGGNLWIVVGPRTSWANLASDDARPLVPMLARRGQRLSQPVSLTPASTDEPMLKAFRDDRNPPLDATSVSYRLEVERLAATARPVMNFSDGMVAAAAMAVGEGSSLVWNFSPAAGQSNLGKWPLVLLAKDAVEQLAGLDASPPQAACGQIITVPWPRAVGGATATLHRPGAAVPEPLPLDLGSQAVTLVPDRPGVWEVHFAAADRRVVRAFAVNADRSEGELDPMSREELAALLDGGERVQIVGSLAEIRHGEGAATRTFDLGPWFWLALLAMLIGESFFANRFYRRPDSQPMAK
jgi:hypothetical protein